MVVFLSASIVFRTSELDASTTRGTKPILLNLTRQQRWGEGLVDQLEPQELAVLSRIGSAVDAAINGPSSVTQVASEAGRIE